MPPTDRSQTGLEDKVVLVTGASRGLGKAVALEAARRGARIVAVARTQGALEALDDEVRALGAEASLVPLDLQDHEGLDRLAQVIAERWRRLDGLAGIGATLGPLTPLPHLDPAKWDEVISTNLTANYRLLRGLDPLLRASEAGRAVFATSDAAVAPPAFWAAYASAKAGLEALVQTYSRECAKTGVCVNLFDPGAMRTAMRAKAMPGEDPATLPEPERIAPQLVDLLLPRETRTGERIAARL